MAAEIITTSPRLDVGPGAHLKAGSEVDNIAGVISAVVLILLVGVGIELPVFQPIERRVLHTRGSPPGPDMSGHFASIPPCGQGVVPRRDATHDGAR